MGSKSRIEWDERTCQSGLSTSEALLLYRIGKNGPIVRARVIICKQEICFREVQVDISTELSIWFKVRHSSEVADLVVW